MLQTKPSERTERDLHLKKDSSAETTFFLMRVRTEHQILTENRQEHAVVFHAS